MLLDQLCFYAESASHASEIRKSLGLLDESWVLDEMEGITYPFGRDSDHKPELTIATLEFCYSYNLEIEILTFLEGWNFLDHFQHKPSDGHGISHVGFHLERGEDFPDMEGSGNQLVQQTETTKHFNPYLIKQQRTYIYRIYWSPATQTFLKYIMRIEPEQE